MFHRLLRQHRSKDRTSFSINVTGFHFLEWGNLRIDEVSGRLWDSQVTITGSEPVWEKPGFNPFFQLDSVKGYFGGGCAAFS